MNIHRFFSWCLSPFPIDHPRHGPDTLGQTFRPSEYLHILLHFKCFVYLLRLPHHQGGEGLMVIVGPCDRGGRGPDNIRKTLPRIVFINNDDEADCRCLKCKFPDGLGLRRLVRTAYCVA